MGLNRGWGDRGKILQVCREKVDLTQRIMAQNGNRYFRLHQWKPEHDGIVICSVFSSEDIVVKLVINISKISQ